MLFRDHALLLADDRPLRGDEPELLQGSHAVVQSDFLGDLAVLHFQHGRSGETHLPAGRCGQRADRKVAVGGTRMRAAAVPTTDHVVALGDEVGRAPEVEIRERLAELGHERLHLRAAPARRAQGALQEDIGRAEFVDDGGVPRIAPELREPATDDRLVLLFLRRYYTVDRSCREATAPLLSGTFGPNHPVWPCQ